MYFPQPFLCILRAQTWGSTPPHAPQMPGSRPGNTQGGGEQCIPHDLFCVFQQTHLAHSSDSPCVYSPQPFLCTPRAQTRGSNPPQPFLCIPNDLFCVFPGHRPGDLAF
jgi:hypothetical protein